MYQRSFKEKNQEFHSHFQLREVSVAELHFLLEFALRNCNERNKRNSGISFTLTLKSLFVISMLHKNRWIGRAAAPWLNTE